MRFCYKYAGSFLKQLPNEQGFEQILVFADNGESGITLDRLGFNRLNKAIDRGEVNTIFVRDFSRIGGNLITTEQWFEKMQKKGINVILTIEG